MKKKLMIIVLSAMLAISATACGSSAGEKKETKPDTTEAKEETKEPETTPPAEEPTKTDNPIELISTGMSYKDVVKAFGVDGGLMSQNTVSGSNVSVWKWDYTDGSGYITVTTQDGIVTAKNDVRLNAATSNITLEIFNSITAGMSYEEVKNLIGSEGTLLSDTDLGGIKSTMYMWKSADGLGNASIMFQNDAVVSGSQTGLK